ncbi:uncharacterized protein LOC110611824 [Manihot esculenta]|uniref:Uncharacterized protein n=1 Tax=Manihot esculenta TaxID=3983 RepID=A0A2C9W6B7_MANES|nr:uncharacterized protein LOC110611824 [Manihot esculenta]OAY54824.1 hypothetical protein MANES_03G104700v8 [Manihot esculenta]
MKISSKSIVSPGRAREPSQISLSNSLSRRLRTNGSMKGGQASPMFPTNGKKRGCAFENPEPSSPKVTCIGQVRVKTKKQGKKLRLRSHSQRRGEVSFRRVDQTNSTNTNNLEPSIHQDFAHNVNNQFLNQQQQQERLPHRNQRWVHLPLTICEALRAFGAEFNCFLPCRSSCTASEKEKEEKAAGSSNGSSCVAVLARWLVTVQEGEGKGREIELVVGEDEEDREEYTERRSYRRHVFEEIEFKEEKYGEGNESMQEEEARLSICIPPKNALLLMRCRSDPVKMAALANKFWEAPVPNVEDEEDGEDDTNKGEEKDHAEVGGGGDEEAQRPVLEQEMKHEEDLMNENWVSCENAEEHQVQEHEANLVVLDIGVVEEGNLGEQEEQTEETPLEGPSPLREEGEDTENSKKDENEELLQESEDNKENELVRAEENEQESNPSDDNVPIHQEQEPKEAGQELPEEDRDESESAETARALAEEVATQEAREEKDSICMPEEGGGESEETATHEGSEPVYPKTQEDEMNLKSKERESQPTLPDCLLLMMREPKLSMEVSKETWVCSTDFIRWLPEHSRPIKKKDGRDEPKKRISIDINPRPLHNNLQQPPRSSCSYPAKPPVRAAGSESMSTAIEQKLVGSKVYEPFVLTRCKSEPMRSAAKLSPAVAPEACFWKNRKLEPHRPATIGVGAAEVGY